MSPPEGPPGMRPGLAPDDLRAITPGRLAAVIRCLNAFGRSPGGGVSRPGYGPEEAEARRWMAGRLAALGAAVQVDRALNLYGWLPAGAAGPGVFAGSHLDSVPDGGEYDGVLGVACGLVALETLRPLLPAAGAPVGLAVFACEESSRFGVGCLGSRLAVGQLDGRAAERLRDGAGVSVAQALGALGGQPERLDGRPDLPSTLGAFLEVHVDQGPDLADAGVPLGVVARIVGPAKVRVTFRGQAGHAGAAPRSRRRDALHALVAFLHGVYARAEGCPEEELRFTVGAVRVEPNAVNVVPGLAEAGMDLRCASVQERDRWLEDLRGAARDVAARLGLEASVEVLAAGGVYECPEALVREIEAAAERCGVPSRRMASFAGHDARVLGEAVPAAMLLAANPAGVSHSPREAVDPEAAAAAARVLAVTMYALSRPGLLPAHAC